MSVVLAAFDCFRIHDAAGPCLQGWARRDPDLVGVRIELMEFPGELLPLDAARRILEARPRLVGFTTYVWNIHLIQETVRHLRRLAPEILIVLGGAEVIPQPDRILEENPAVDFVALGEGEETFRLLLRAVLLEDRPYALVPGLAYRDDGRVVKTEAAPLIDLALAPGIYAETEWTGDKALLETARGCPFLCSFCDWGPRRMRYVPLDQVAREIESVTKRFKYVVLCDADLLMDKNRGLALLKMFRAAGSGTDVVFQFDTNPIFLCDEAIEIVASAPRNFQLCFGLQSVNERTVKKLHRPFDLPRMEANLRRLRDRCPEAKINFSYIYGLPGDDYASFRATADWAMQWGPNAFGASQLMMLPGADMAGEKHPGMRYQTTPPYQVLESDEMTRADMAKARELSYYGWILFSLPADRGLSCANVIYGAGSDAQSFAPGERIALLEGWIEHIKTVGIDLTFGLSIADTDEFALRQNFYIAMDRLAADRMTATAVRHATRRFAALRIAKGAVN